VTSLAPKNEKTEAAPVDAIELEVSKKE